MNTAPKVERRAAEDAAGLPLSGLRIVELSSYVATPLAGMTLAQLGADVIRIDPVGGAPDRRRWPLAPSGESLYWAGLNKHKRSMTVDIRSSAGAAVVAELLARGDGRGGVLLTNTDLAADLSLEHLREHRPDLIHVRLMGRADGGTAVDYTVNAEIGFAAVTGPANLKGPVNHVVPVWDVAAGLYLAVGILAAVHRRMLTGQGQQVSIALHDVALATAGNLGLLAEAQLGAERPRIGNDVYGSFGRDFALADGHGVMIVVLTSRHWRDLLATTSLAGTVTAIEAALGADFGSDADRYRHRGVLFGLLEPWFGQRTTEQVRHALEPTSVLWSVFRSFGEAVRDDSAAGCLLSEIDQPRIGHHYAPGSPLTFNGDRIAPRPAPQLGQHTGDILRGVLGYTTERVAELERARAIGPQSPLGSVPHSD